jgi:HEAT repeats
MRHASILLLTLSLATVACAQQLTGRFLPDKDSYAVGEPLYFSLEIKNTGTEPVYLYAKAPGRCQDTFTFSVQQVTDRGPGSACGITFDMQCVDDPHLLKPGDVFTGRWPLDFWYRLQRPASYRGNAARDITVSSASAGIRQFKVSSDFQFRLVAADKASRERARGEMEAGLRSDDPDVRHEALDGIATVAPAYFQDKILRLARDKDVFNVQHAIGALQRLNLPEDRAALAEIIASRDARKSPDELIARCNAIYALGESGDAAYASTLEPYMEHDDTCESLSAMRAVATLARSGAVPRLQAFLQGPRSKLRENAARSLRFTVSPEAVDALIGALRDPDETVRHQALAGLTALTGHSFAQAGQASLAPLRLEDLWRAWWHDHRADTVMIEPMPDICRMN